MAKEIAHQPRPVVAILGRPNVGKSTLFNQLTRTRDALVADIAGVTRDINVGTGKVGDAPFLVADTGGIDTTAKKNIGARVTEQALSIIDDSDALLLIVDAREGINAEDEAIANALRRTGKPTYVVVNKIDGADPEIATAEFSRLGFNQPIPISARDGRGINSLIDEIGSDWPTAEDYPVEQDTGRMRVAVVGRPNVGKSTLVNRMLGEQRMITADLPGTTHDSVATDFERRDDRYTLIDTAGLRRRSRVSGTIEKFSAVKALQAIDVAQVVLVVLDAQERVTDQDAHLLGLVLESGRSVVIAINKWDGISNEQRELIKRELERKLTFIDYAERVFISALHGTGVGGLFDQIKAAWTSSQMSAPTNRVTELLERAIEAHPPPMVKGRRVKLRYAHFGGRNPPTIIIHGNQTNALPNSYKRYLANFYRETFRLVGTPVRIDFKQSENPYAGKRNTLTPRQVQRKRRLMKHVKSKR